MFFLCGGFFLTLTKYGFLFQIYNLPAILSKKEESESVSLKCIKMMLRGPFFFFFFTQQLAVFVTLSHLASLTQLLDMPPLG